MLTAPTDSNMARDSFATFIPLSVDSDARTKIIFDFFDLLSAIAAHAKTNGLGGRKLSRLAGWWAFEHTQQGEGFGAGYKTWAAYVSQSLSLNQCANSCSAADAASHLFFAYLRSLSPGSVKGINGISTLPMSLQKLVQETEYPPETPTLLQSSITKVIMIVDSVSPTPFALLRRANHFQYRDDDRVLQEFAEYDDPVKALTDECRRVLKSISSANQSQVSNSKESTGLPDASWSRFEDIGFSGAFDENEENDDDDGNIVKRRPQGLKSTPQSRNIGLGRPTTPSWADFLSSGFVDEAQNGPAPLLLPPDKILPPIDVNTRGRSSQSHRPRLENTRNLEPGELASIARLDLDDSFWWVWITSLAGEEPPERKAAFGRCALVETIIPHGRWLVMEEMVKGAAPKPDPTAYIAEKKSFWGRSRKNKGMSRSKSTGKHHLEPHQPQDRPLPSQSAGMSKTSVGPDQHARIQAAAIQLQKREREQELQAQGAVRRGRNENEGHHQQKTSSVFTLQPVIMSEASPAMKWASKYDKDAIKEAYLANSNAGRGHNETKYTNGSAKSQETLKPVQSQLPAAPQERSLPAAPSSKAPPTVPSKTVPPPAAVPQAPTKESNEQEHALADKAAEAGLPHDPHPVERRAVTTPTAAPVEPQSQQSRPSTEKVGSSPESKMHHKLKKKEVGGTSGGFKKMFGRNKRETKLPEPAPETANGSSLQPGNATIGRRFSGFRKKSPVATPAEASSTISSKAPISEDDTTPVPTPYHDQGRSYDPSVNSLSRVDTNEAQEALQEFSRFDQGPLEDVPAFAPQESPRQSEEVDEAVPPPITKHRSEDKVAEVEPAQEPLPRVSDHWAQIRKHAADRAARQSEEQSHGTRSQKTDGEDGETSGEESKCPYLPLGMYQANIE